MGFDWAIVYGKDFATDLETAKALLSKIESRTETDKDLEEFSKVSTAIVEYASKNKD